MTCQVDAPVRPIQRGCRFAQRGEHQPVPFGDDLVVEAGSWPHLPRGEQPLAELLDPLRAGPLASMCEPVGDAAAVEVPLVGDAPPGERGVGVGAEDGAHLCGRESVEEPFVPMAVRAG